MPVTENSLSLEKGQGGNGGSPARGRRRSTFPFPLLWALFLTVSLYYLFPFFWFKIYVLCSLNLRPSGARTLIKVNWVRLGRAEKVEPPWPGCLVSHQQQVLFKSSINHLIDDFYSILSFTHLWYNAGIWTQIGATGIITRIADEALDGGACGKYIGNIHFYFGIYRPNKPHTPLETRANKASSNIIPDIIRTFDFFDLLQIFELFSSTRALWFSWIFRSKCFFPRGTVTVVGQRKTESWKWKPTRRMVLACKRRRHRFWPRTKKKTEAGPS